MMSEQERDQEEQGGTASATAVKAVAAAAATGAATYAVRKALSSGSGPDEASATEHDADGSEERDDNGSSRSSGKIRQLATPSMLAGASQILLPLAEVAADSAGRYVAEHAPDAIREQVVPRFIKAFEKAS